VSLLIYDGFKVPGYSRTDYAEMWITLAWLLPRYERMPLIPGASSVAHLEENMAAVELELDVVDLDAVDCASLDDES
jgi:aryl-alcohol dehydrogenase-like predicted oxidoreductase